MAARYDKAKMYTERFKGQFIPCRYCGNTDIRVWTETETFGGKPYWTVNCMTEFCDTIRVNRIRDAVRLWNNRHSIRVERGVK